MFHTPNEGFHFWLKEDVGRDSVNVCELLSALVFVQKEINNNCSDQL